MVLRAKHVQHARLTHTTHQDLALLLRCPKCEHPGALLEGADAEQALRQRPDLREPEEGQAHQAEGRGGRIVRRAPRRPGASSSANTARREITVSTLRGAEGLAMEMAVDEQAEVRDLEREWRRAEEIAEIADNLTLPPSIEQELKDLKEKRQPNS